MGRLALLLFVVAALAAGPGCGSADEVPDDEIVEALDLEPSPDRPVYTIGGDPFCEVDDNLLNSSDEIEAASEGDELGLVITDRDQEVGVQGVPPFDPECGRKARRALNRL